MDGYVPGNYFSIKGQMVSIVNINNINGEGAGNYQALYIPSYADDIFATIAGCY
ncbi:MAG: hypothetical protein IPK18_09640 [Sphingobacteriales bacterium]|nr:MAG: hypothetical protein IPK18_09640 [Sphingobacteriales bacterium]